MDFPLLVGFGANSGEGAWSNPQPLRRDCPELLFLLLILVVWCSGHPKGGSGLPPVRAEPPFALPEGLSPFAHPGLWLFFWEGLEAARADGSGISVRKRSDNSPPLLIVC